MTYRQLVRSIYAAGEHGRGRHLSADAAAMLAVLLKRLHATREAEALDLGGREDGA